MKHRGRILQTFMLLIGLCGFGIYTVRQGSPFLITLLISLGIVLLYAFLMEISERAAGRLKALPYISYPDRRALIALSFRIALPLYLCLFCTACIPLFRWELWLLTGLPILVLFCIPLYAMMEEFHDHRLSRALFASAHLGAVSAVYAVGQSVGWGVAKLLMLI